MDARFNEEHAQRLTLQHHACDQAKRIADLETKCTTLKELHDAAADERDAAQLLADGTGADAYAHCCDNVEAWRRKRGHETSGPEGSLCNWVDWAMGVADERDALRARLAEIEAQEPAASVETSGNQGAGISWTGAALPVGSKLYALPATAQAVPMSDERIDAIADLVIKSMPDGLRGFIRTWGYHQFARALLDVCAGHYRAVPAQDVPDGWRPMNSAPRDGTAVLALLAGSDVAHAVRWLPDGNKSSGSAGWHVVWDLSAVAQHDGPTHWMPIPDAPEHKA